MQIRGWGSQPGTLQKALGWDSGDLGHRLTLGVPSVLSASGLSSQCRAAQVLLNLGFIVCYMIDPVKFFLLIQQQYSTVQKPQCIRARCYSLVRSGILIETLELIQTRKSKIFFDILIYFMFEGTFFSPPPQIQ